MFAHQPAVFFTHPGIVDSAVPETVVAGTSIMLFETSHSIPETNELSSITQSDHHPALFLIQDGIVSLCAEAANGNIVTTVNKVNNKITLCM